MSATQTQARDFESLFGPADKLAAQLKSREPSAVKVAGEWLDVLPGSWRSGRSSAMFETAHGTYLVPLDQVQARRFAPSLILCLKQAEPYASKQEAERRCRERGGAGVYPCDGCRLLVPYQSQIRFSSGRLNLPGPDDAVHQVAAWHVDVSGESRCKNHVRNTGQTIEGLMAPAA
jgi:hypothetical protein